MRLIPGLTLFLLVPALFAADKDPVNLRGKGPAKGLKFTTTSTNNVTDAATVVKVNGKEAAKYTESSLETTESETEVLAVDGGRASKLRYKTTKDETKQTRKAGDKSHAETFKNPLVGLTVIAERTKTG